MSMFENNQYRWRETYFVMFDAVKRPSLKEVHKALSALSKHYVLTNLSAEDTGEFDSLTVLSPEDFAALDICYTGGAEVIEQAEDLIEEMDPANCSAEALGKIQRADSRFDVLHFEQVSEADDDPDELDEMLDPSALLLVLEALATITDGVAIDPQGGTFLDTDGCEL